jgi:hypothetical protein
MPTVTGITPASGISGTPIVISGSGFTGATAVNFGVTAATSFVTDGDTLILAVVPGGSDTVDVTVVTPSGTSVLSASDQFTYASFPSGTTVNNVIANITAISGLVPTAADIIPYINELLKTLGKDARNIEGVSITTAAGAWNDLPQDFIAIQMVLDAAGRQLYTYQTTEDMILFPYPGAYTIKYYALPTPVATGTDTLDCHELLTPAFAPWCCFRLQNDPNDADAIGWANQAQSVIASAKAQIQPRRQNGRVVR